LQALWERPVAIVTRGEGKGLMLRHDGKEFTEKKVDL